MLGENVGVVEGAYGNGSGYVKIGPVIDVWKAEVETFDKHWYVTAPCGTYVSTHFKPGSNTHVAMDVKVQGASEYWFGCWDGNWDDRAFALGNDGNSVYCGYGSGNTTCGGIGSPIPSGRMTVALEKGVDDGQIRVKSGTYDITGAFSISGGEIALNPNGAVTIGGEEIPVKPTIGDLDEGEPFTVGKGAVMITVRAIPGLRYALVRGETVEGCRRDGGGTVIESVVATGTRVALSDANPPEGGAFYRIVVKIEEF